MNDQTFYICWPVALDTALRAQYLALTGESIQEAPPLEEGGLRHMAGSARVDEAQCLLLAQALPGVVFGENPSIFNWIPAIEMD